MDHCLASPKNDYLASWTTSSPSYHIKYDTKGFDDS